MEIRYAPNPDHILTMDTQDLRANFLVEDLFEDGEINLLYSDVDRAIIGGAVPTDNADIKLEAGSELRADFFCQRREIGVICTGGEGSIVVDGTDYPMVKLDCLYIGRGSKEIEFKSSGGPCYFYMVSFPAHKEYPTTHGKMENAEPVTLGSSKECNERTIYKYIFPGGIESCQLVMGCTLMEEGSVWNTMPSHTHERRCEIYLYFDVPEDQMVWKFIGEPQETRHIAVKNREAVVTPSWSIHSGAGTTNYSFVWAMGGENQDFGDMDHIKVTDML